MVGEGRKLVGPGAIGGRFLNIYCWLYFCEDDYIDGLDFQFHKP